MGKKQAPVSTYCEICERAGHKRVGEAVIKGHVVCGFHMCCLEDGEEGAWPIVSNWANNKRVIEFQGLLRPLFSSRPTDDEDKINKIIRAVYEHGVNMKLDPEQLRRRERVWVARRWIERRETGAEYAARVNAYLERYIAEEAVKIARKRREASGEQR